MCNVKYSALFDNEFAQPQNFLNISVVVLLISSQMVSGVVSQCESTFDALWLRHPGGLQSEGRFCGEING